MRAVNGGLSILSLTHNYQSPKAPTSTGGRSPGRRSGLLEGGGNIKNFVLVNIRDEKEIKKYQKDQSFEQSVILPYYSEGYICFSSRQNYSFEELTEMFFQGDEDEQIGAISIISERYSCELYRLICNQSDCFSPKKLRFIFDFVVPSYLPLILPKERLMDYEFAQEFLSDIWVNILVKIRSLL